MTQSSLQEALQLLQTGRVPQAAAILRKLASDQPQNADAQHLLGMALFKSGDASSALAPLRRAIELDPKRPDFHFNLGAVLASMKRHDDAIDCYNRALQLRPEYPQALNNLGNSLRTAGRFDKPPPPSATRSFSVPITSKPTPISGASWPLCATTPTPSRPSIAPSPYDPLPKSTIISARRSSIGVDSTNPSTPSAPP